VTPPYGLADGVGVGPSVGVGDACPSDGTHAAAASARRASSATTLPARRGDDGRELGTG
jgi:hypothetical protein